MDDILAKKNRHLFLEEKDNTSNSFIGNINIVADDLDNIDIVAEHINNVIDVSDHIDEIDKIAYLLTTSAFNYSAVVTVVNGINANDTVTLPNPMKYKVGAHMLLVSWNGVVCYEGEQYEEVGDIGAISTTVKFKQKIKSGDKIEFRIAVIPD